MTDLALRAATFQRIARRRLRRVPVVWFFAAAALVLALVLSAGVRVGFASAAGAPRIAEAAR